MAKADRVSLTFEADLGPLIKRLKEIPDLTGAEVRRATSALRKGTKALQKDARGVTKSAQQVGAGVKSIGDASGDAESSLRAVAGVIGLVSPEAEKALASVAELGGGLEGVTRATELFGGNLGSVLRIAGPVGIAVAAMGVAHMVAARQVKEAEEAMEAAAEAATRAQTAFGQTSQVVQNLEREFSVLSGAMEEDAQALADQQKEIGARFRFSRGALERQIAELQKQKDAIKASGASAQEQATQLAKVNDRISVQTGILNGLNKREERALFLAEANSDLRKQEPSQRDNSSKAMQRQADAARALAEAQAQVEAEALAAMDAADREIRTLEQLRDLAAIEPRTSFQETEQKINDEYRERLALVEEFELLNEQTAESQAARDAVEADRSRQLAEVEAEQLAYLDGERERYAEAQRKRDELAAARRLTQIQNAGTALSTFAGGVADASRFAAEQMAQENADGARRMFAVSKAAAISQAIINGALAVTQALAQLGPIFGPIAAGGVAATTAAQVGIIAAQEPSFNDTPGPISLPRGGAASFAAGDFVVAGKDLGDMRRQIDAADGRQRQPMVQVVGIPLYEGRTYERARRDAYRRPGADSRALNSVRRQGQGGW